MRASFGVLVIGLLAAASGAEPSAPATLPPRALKAKDVFDLPRLVIFSDDFSQGTLDRWFIRESYGSPQTKPTRTNKKLDAPIVRGRWGSWVVHAKWSPGDEGSLKIWKDSEVVFERMRPNVYGTIGVEDTPYLKTALIIPSGRGLASGADQLRVAQRRTAWAAGPRQEVGLQIGS